MREEYGLGSRFEDKLKKSAQQFRDLVWPAMGELLGGGRIIPVELVTDSEFAGLLDWLAGVDAWQVVDQQGMRGLASRVQNGPRCWETWTLRSSRPGGRGRYEFQRLLEGGEWLRPHWYVHAYVYEGELLGAAAIQTSDLIEALRNGLAEQERFNGEDDVGFRHVKWSRAACNYEVIVWPTALRDGSQTSLKLTAGR